MEPTDMSDQHSKSDAIVSSGVHGQHRPVNDEYMPKSIWQPNVVRRLADYIQHVREVDGESNQRAVASKSGESTKPKQPGESHVCPRHPYRTCNCPAWACADDDATYRYARGPFVATDPNQRVPAPKPNHLGNFNCPIDNKLCSSDVCNGWCESSGAGTETDTNRGNASTTLNR